MPAPKIPKGPLDYKVSHLAFATDITPITAYLLGLIWADGYVGPLVEGVPTTSTQVVFTTTVPDDGHFVPLFESTGQWGVYRTPPPKAHPTWRTRINLMTRNPFLSGLLLNHGYRSKSSEGADKILALIPAPLHRHFFLGLVDGDGCFSCARTGGKNMYRFSLSSSHEQDWGYVERWLTSIGVAYRIERTSGKRGSYSKVHVIAGPDILRLGEHLYQANHTGLPRKQAKYQLIRDTFRPKTSRHKGVCFTKGKWRAFGSQQNGQPCRWLGAFDTEEAAASCVRDQLESAFAQV